MKKGTGSIFGTAPGAFLRCWRDAADAGRMHEGMSLPNRLALATKIGNEESKSIQKLRALRHKSGIWKEMPQTRTEVNSTKRG